MNQGRATADDVARTAGVSRATVSYVLNNNPHQKISDATRARVLDAARRLAYTPSAPARSLSRGRSDLVVMLIPDWPLGPIIPGVMDAIAEGLAPHGLELMMHRCRSGEDVGRLWRAVTPRAVVRFGSLGAEVDAGLRTAQIGYLVEVTDTDSSPGQNLFPGEEVGELQAGHLVERGHLQLGYAWPADDRLEPIARARVAGVRAVCAARGLAEPSQHSVALGVEGAREALSGWLAEGVTGVACFSDDVALALIQAARGSNIRVPDDLALVGVDNQAWGAAIEPALTSVGARPDLIGRAIVDNLVAGLAGQAVPVPPEHLVVLVVRSST